MHDDRRGAGGVIEQDDGAIAWRQLRSERRDSEHRADIGVVEHRGQRIAVGDRGQQHRPPANAGGERREHRGARREQDGAPASGERSHEPRRSLQERESRGYRAGGWDAVYPAATGGEGDGKE